MPVPLPDPAATHLGPPDAAEVAALCRGLITAAAPDGGLRPVQRMLLEAVVPAMTGHPADLRAAPIGPEDFAASLAHRDAAFRGRIVQLMVLHALLLRPLPEDVAARVTAFARELSTDERVLDIAREMATDHRALAAVDFERNGYGAQWSPSAAAPLHTTGALPDAWAQATDDPALAARWRELEALPADTLGGAITRFYRARGFTYPGLPDSAPPLLAQHDWVHVLADYGTTVESELEVFAFIARANDDMRGFTLLAMVVSLFETGNLAAGAGLFEADTGHLSRTGMAARVADAMRRGALSRGSTDFLQVDWFSLADMPLDRARDHFGVPAKAPAAAAAGSVGPWDPGGISPFQDQQGRDLAARQGRPYDAYGARPDAAPVPPGRP